MEHAAALDDRWSKNGESVLILASGVAGIGTGIDDVQRINRDYSAVDSVIGVYASNLKAELGYPCLGVGRYGVGGRYEPCNVIVGGQLCSQNEGADLGVGRIDDGNGLIVSGGFRADVTASAGDAGGCYGEDENEKKNESKEFLFQWNAPLLLNEFCMISPSGLNSGAGVDDVERIDFNFLTVNDVDVVGAINFKAELFNLFGCLLDDLSGLIQKLINVVFIGFLRMLNQIGDLFVGLFDDVAGFFVILLAVSGFFGEGEGSGKHQNENENDGSDFTVHGKPLFFFERQCYV